MKAFSLLLFITTLLLASSCQKCRVCTCDLNNTLVENENCAYGGGSSNETQKVWEQMLREDCPNLECRTEK